MASDPDTNFSKCDPDITPVTAATDTNHDPKQKCRFRVISTSSLSLLTAEAQTPSHLPNVYSPLTPLHDSRVNQQSRDDHELLESRWPIQCVNEGHLKYCDREIATQEPCKRKLAHQRSSRIPDMYTLMTVVFVIAFSFMSSCGPVLLAEASLPHPIVRPQGSKVKGEVVDLCEQLDIRCVHGMCVNGTSPQCVCEQGWQGSACDTCGGRMKLTDTSGYIIDGYTNYSTNTKCTWLIEAQNPNTVMRFRFLHFATECSWDHLYMYDGSSVFAPQLAAYSGLVIPNGASMDLMPEIVTTSGHTYLHFYSDAAYNMSGFNISYIMGPSCPLNCSGSNGVCVQTSGVCDCLPMWTGPGCDIPACPNNCSYPKGECSETEKRCNCITGRGPDCSIPLTSGEWSQVTTSNPPNPRASHQHVVWKDYMYVFYGYSFSSQPSDYVVRFHLTNYEWEIINVQVTGTNFTIPRQRYGHTVALYKDKVYMFGGLIKETNTITKELWEFDLLFKIWKKLTLKGEAYEVVGHMVHVIEDIMYVIFGHNPVLGYLNMVQEFNIETGDWRVPHTSGAVVKGGYGQTSVLDSARGLIYVHGGYVSTSPGTYALIDNMYSFDPKQRSWSILKSSGQPKFLHSAALLNGMMYVFGGNTHNDTNVSQGAKCYSTNFLAYDTTCNVWLELDPPQLHRDISRFGHIMLPYNKNIYMFGGFDGQVLNDLYLYTPGDCQKFPSREQCLSNKNGVKCSWSDNSKCSHSNGNIVNPQRSCPATPPDDSRYYCKHFGTCQSCTSSEFYDCTWCDQQCVYSKDETEECAKSQFAFVRKPTECLANNSTSSAHCRELHNCKACNLDKRCSWDSKGPSCNSFTNKEETTCNRPCSQYTRCDNCTRERCMWCGNQQRCVESISYVASFPYGQCMEWTTDRNRCTDTYCAGLRTCEACQNSPACGWCDDGSNTGLGLCMEGMLEGPHGGQNVDHNMCPADRWYFESCPECQCNGHSQCYNDTDTCIYCEDDTIGDHCEMCEDGYFGTATNGGNCSVCECNGQADMCDRVTGKCFCHTRGVKGDHCDVCDKENKYYGDPKNGGTCYYALNINYRFTFNLSQDKDESRYQTHINFMNEPPDPDRDVDFSINCSSDKALMNITIKTGDNEEEEVLYANIGCQKFDKQFAHKEYPLGAGSNTTFYVYVYNFKTPFVVEISFLQIDPIDLIHFFITFFSCFLSLLLIAAVVWKVKQKCDMYRRRQRMVVEMEQMASRPFAACNMDLPMALEEPFLKQEAVNTAASITGSGRASQRWKKAAQARYSPSPVALEPIGGNKAAVLSLLVRLPTGDEEYAPAGQQGVAIGSALVTIGNHRKNSTDPVQRVDKSIKHRKQTSVDAPDNCV